MCLSLFLPGASTTLKGGAFKEVLLTPIDYKKFHKIGEYSIPVNYIDKPILLSEVLLQYEANNVILLSCRKFPVVQGTNGKLLTKAQQQAILELYKKKKN